MSKTLNLSIFRFNAKTDFLRYYKNYEVEFDTTKALKVCDILKTIKDKEFSFDFDSSENAYVKINKKIVKIDREISIVIDEFGLDLTIEPLSDRHSTHDLIINENNFLSKLNTFNFLDESDKNRYLEYKHLYFASDIIRYNDDYLGDALFALSSDLLEKYPEKEMEILEALADIENGIFLYVGNAQKLFKTECNCDLDEKVKKLKRKILAKVKNSYIRKRVRNIESGFNFTKEAKKAFKKECSIIGEVKRIWQEVR